VGFQGRRVESQLHLAWLELAQNRQEEALRRVQGFLGFLQSSPPGLLEEPVEDLWTAYTILSASKDPRAAEVLTRAYTLLQARITRMPEAEMRRCYLEEIPAHAQVQAEWGR
jgi:hypothetical protein